MPTAEEQLLADAILRHRSFALAAALRRALRAQGEDVPAEEDDALRAYTDSINIDMVPDGFRYVTRAGVPLLGLGPLELVAQADSPQLLTRCAVWYGAEARLEWQRRGGT